MAERASSGWRGTSGDGVRLVVDASGVEWEVWDEATDSIALALDWDHQPQPDNPGLIFTSRLGRRRLWPAPPAWRELSDEALRLLLDRARQLY